MSAEPQIPATLTEALNLPTIYPHIYRDLMDYPGYYLETDTQLLGNPKLTRANESPDENPRVRQVWEDLPDDLRGRVYSLNDHKGTLSAAIEKPSLLDIVALAQVWYTHCEVMGDVYDGRDRYVMSWHTWWTK